MAEMYNGIPFSPQAALADSIGASDTVIPVSDVNAFPTAPSYATIGTDEEGETILYTAKTATALSGCTRGVEGTAKAWPEGVTIARNFTYKDFAALQENIRANKTAADNAQKTANEAVGREIPAKVSQLENDKNYMTSFTESDPTVPNWAKQPTKPSYSAGEVGALPANTVVPDMSESFSVTLLSSAWSGNAQTVSNAKFLAAGFGYVVAPDGDSYGMYASSVIYADDVTVNGKMTFHCGEVPSDSLTVNIMKIEVSA